MIIEGAALFHGGIRAIDPLLMLARQPLLIKLVLYRQIFSHVIFSPPIAGSRRFPADLVLIVADLFFRLPPALVSPNPLIDPRLIGLSQDIDRVISIFRIRLPVGHDYLLLRG